MHVRTFSCGGVDQLRAEAVVTVYGAAEIICTSINHYATHSPRSRYRWRRYCPTPDRHCDPRVTRRLKLPFTVMLVLVGIGLAAVSAVYPHVLPVLHDLEISSALIFYVFLPTLIFESAFNLDARQLCENLGSVLVLAVPGLLLSTIIIGLIVGIATPIPYTAALFLGAILSATDPVAVIAVFRRLGTPQNLRVLVEGESLFNDATSVVLARILLGVVLAGTVSDRSSCKEPSISL